MDPTVGFFILLLIMLGIFGLGFETGYIYNENRRH